MSTELGDITVDEGPQIGRSLISVRTGDATGTGRRRRSRAVNGRDNGEKIKYERERY